MADPLSIAGSIAGLVAIADSVFTRVYRYTKAVKGAGKEIQDLSNGLRDLSGLLHNLEVVLSALEDDGDNTIDPHVRLRPINSCRETLLKIQKKLESHNPEASGKSTFENTIRKLKWPFSGPEMKLLLADVERHKATINIALAGDSLAMVLKALSQQDNMAQDIKELRNEQKERWSMDTHIALTQKRKEVLNFFGKIDPATNHRTNLKLHCPLTGLWLTEGQTFKTWLHTRNSRLWLSGIPGAGKTILAAFIIEETMKESSCTRAVAYFYCDYKDGNTQDPINIISSLAVQLGRQNEDAFNHLQRLYDSCHPESRSPSPPDLHTLLEKLVNITSCFDDVTFIIDGLDECGDKVYDVAKSLTNVVSKDQSNVRMLFLSRDEYEIRVQLEKEYTQLQIAAHTEDLELYVASEIESRQSKKGRQQLRIRSVELKQHIIRTLIDGAAGM